MANALTFPNPDLVVGDDNKPRWNEPAHRRHGFFNLHRLWRYGLTFRAAQVMPLELRADPRIAAMPDLQRLVELPFFSAMLVLRGRYLLFERYASDFGPAQPHSIQSVSKTMMNLIMGRLVGDGAVSLEEKVSTYLPEIGSGYTGASIQQVLDMDVANEYSEDYDDPYTMAYFHEEAEGFRLPLDFDREQTMRSFIGSIGGSDVANRTGHMLYKSANTDVLAWIAERVTGQSLRAILAEIVDAAGFEGQLHVATDRLGVPVMNSGLCLTARDLARYGAIFARRGWGADGRQVGSASFIERSLEGGLSMPEARKSLRYSNHVNTNGRWLGHGGYGGQYMLVDLTTGVVGVFLSVLDNRSGYDPAYYAPIIRTLEAIGEMTFEDDSAALPVP